MAKSYRGSANYAQPCIYENFLDCSRQQVLNLEGDTEA